MPIRYVTPIAREFSDDGLQVGAGYELYFYEPGTATPKDTFTDDAFTTPSTNPVVADSDGRFAEIFLVGNYKVILKDDDGVQIWSADNVSGMGGNWDDVSEPGICVDTIADLRALTAVDGAYPACISVGGHTAVGDGGGGIFRTLTGAAGTYSDDDGVTVVFAGGDGSVAAVRDVQGHVFASWYGATGLPTGDDTVAIQAAIDFAYSSRHSIVRLGPAHRITNIVLKNNVVLEGVDSSGSISDPFTVPADNNKSCHYSALVQIDGSTGAAVSHPYDTSDPASSETYRGRGFGLRRVYVMDENDARLTDGIVLEHGAYIIMDDVRTQGFDQAVVLSDIYDSTLSNIRTGGANHGLTITNPGVQAYVTNNSNNLLILHNRNEGWRKSGCRVLSQGGAPNQNNKLTFIHQKNEGSPGSEGEGGIIIDGVVDCMWLHGDTSIKSTSTPPSTFVMVDLRADTTALWGTRFIDHRVATNGNVSIDSLIRYKSGPTTHKYFRHEWLLNTRDTETFVNGLVNIESDLIEEGVVTFNEIRDNGNIIFGGTRHFRVHGQSAVPQLPT